MKNYLIVSIGEKLLPGTDAIGGDKRKRKEGFVCELVGSGRDGCPTCLGWYRSVEDAATARAERVSVAY